MAFGRGNSNINISDMNDEYAVFSWWKPYIMQASGTAILFFGVALVRIAQWIAYHFFNHAPATAQLSWGTIITGLAVTFFIYKFYHRRGEQGNEVLIRFHPTITALMITAWATIAWNDNPTNWMFGELSLYLFFFGAIFLGVTWAGRRWSFKNFQQSEPVQQVNDWEVYGMGMTSSSRAESVPGGKKYKLKLDPKMSFHDLVDKLVFVAKKFGVKPEQVRLSEDDDPNFAYTTILDEIPFKRAISWQGPHNPGASIVDPIEFATYDTGSRPGLRLVTESGELMHWLTVGFTGAGKTAAWQAVYGTVLNRTEVSLIYIDPVKGVNSAMPLASGIEWFGDGFDQSIPIIDGIERAIKARMDYLSNNGKNKWMPGCGLNFIILHIEEAADFMSTAKEIKPVRDKLTRILRTARSAGIEIVYSLQRPDHKNIPTDLRSNLVGRACFGVTDKGEAEIGLSGIAKAAGALPQLLRNPGTFYLTGLGIDHSMAGNVLRSDYVDDMLLELAVDQGAQYRTPLDATTAAAFGSEYYAYRKDVETDNTEWQKIRRNRMPQAQPQEGTFKAPESDSESPTVEFNTQASKSDKASRTKSDKQFYIDNLWNYINQIDGEFTRKEVAKGFTLKAASWTYAQLAKWIDEDKLGENGNKLFIK